MADGEDANFITVARAKDIAPGAMKAVSIRGCRVVVANLGDSYCAFNATCPHEGELLDQGTLWEGVVTCPRHHYQYDALSGKNLYPSNIYPSHARERYAAQLRSLAIYDVRVVEDTIQIKTT